LVALGENVWNIIVVDELSLFCQKVHKLIAL
jgi:hypothetical protein